MRTEKVRQRQPASHGARGSLQAVNYLRDFAQLALLYVPSAVVKLWLPQLPPIPPIEAGRGSRKLEHDFSGSLLITHAWRVKDMVFTITCSRGRRSSGQAGQIECTKSSVKSWVLDRCFFLKYCIMSAQVSFAPNCGLPVPSVNSGQYIYEK